MKTSTPAARLAHAQAHNPAIIAQTSASHTPGPWILQTDENDIFVEVVDSATEGVTLGTFPADDVGYANARLIAASPRLLECLQKTLGTLSALANSELSIDSDENRTPHRLAIRDDVWKQIEQARAAIQSATL